MRTPRGVSFSTNAAAALAILSVGLAVWLSFQPHRLGDLGRVAGWTAAWLQGASLYGPGSDVDYPPWAIVTLSPLALVPPAILPALWIGCNLGALVFVARRLARTRAEVCFLLIAAGAMRTLNQFSLVSLALAVGGVTSSSRLGPVWLGLSLMKPQIGAVFLLEALWQRRWRVAALASLVPIALTGVFALHAHVPALGLPAAYARAINLQYGDVLWGQTEVTSWLQSHWPSVPGIVLALLVAVLVFAPLARARTQLGLALASLLSLRHLSYDLILLLPWMSTLPPHFLWLAAGLLVADPSAVAGVLMPGSWLAQHADRVGLGLLWVALTIQLKRHRRTQ